MEIARIKEDTIYLLFHSSEAAEVGEQFLILEEPSLIRGIVVQIISTDSHQYPGLEQELMQSILETQIAETEREFDREYGLSELKNLKIATGKIRKKIDNGRWVPWDGWIPTRNVQIQPLTAEILMVNIMPSVEFPITFSTYRENPVIINGRRLDKVNVVTGVKGSGKSHLAKHLVISLSQLQIPCIIFDINGEYSSLPNALTLRWGENFLPDLAQLGFWMILELVDSLNPLPQASRNVLEHRLAYHFGRRRAWCMSQNIPFSLDIQFLLQQPWSDNELVQGAIERRLRMLDGLRLFRRGGPPEENVHTSFSTIFEVACDGNPIVLDLRDQSIKMQKALAGAVITQIRRICDIESLESGRGRYPFLFFEEAHFYIEEEDIMDIITRGRHIGLSSVFITNTPQKLPETVFRQLDNLYLMRLTHQNDIKQVSKNSFTDEETIECFATRILPHDALLIGDITERYPLIVHVDPLPPEVGPTGVTRSTWSRLRPNP